MKNKSNIISMKVLTMLKVLVPIHSLIPPTCFKLMEILEQKLSHIYKASCMKFYAQSRCSENPS